MRPLDADVAVAEVVPESRVRLTGAGGDGDRVLVAPERGVVRHGDEPGVVGHVQEPVAQGPMADVPLNSGALLPLLTVYAEPDLAGL